MVRLWRDGQNRKRRTLRPLDLRVGAIELLEILTAGAY